MWVAVSLTYLLGDVLRLYSGDYQPGAQIGGVAMSQAAWLGVAIVLSVPIVMVLLSLALERRLNRWANFVAAAGMFGFNAIGLPTYVGMYDQFLIVLSLLFNVVTFVVSLRWPAPERA